VQLKLNGVLGNVRERQAALGIDSDQTRAHADFRARIFVGPNIVRIREGTI
jgi:hypothetical protein